MVAAAAQGTRYDGLGGTKMNAELLLARSSHNAHTAADPRPSGALTADERQDRALRRGLLRLTHRKETYISGTQNLSKIAARMASPGWRPGG